MYRTLCCCLMLLAVLASRPAGADEDAGRLYAEGLLLEKGQRKPNEALKVYQELWKSYKRTRFFAARALYRMGLIHLRRGEKGAAREYFNHLTHQFKEQRELVELCEQALRELGGRSEERERHEQRKREERGERKESGDLEKLVDKLREAGIPTEIAQAYAQLKGQTDQIKHTLERRQEQLRARLRHAGEDMLGDRSKESVMQQFEKLAGQVIELYSARRDQLGGLARLHSWTSRLRHEKKLDRLHEAEKKLERYTAKFRKKAGALKEKQAAAGKQLIQFLDHWLPERHRAEPEEKPHNPRSELHEALQQKEHEMLELRKRLERTVKRLHELEQALKRRRSSRKRKQQREDGFY